MHHVTKNAQFHAWMAPRSTTGKIIEDLFHDSQLQLQERMRNPIAFNAKMMGDIMYLQQVLREPAVKEFVQAIIKVVRWTCGLQHLDTQKKMQSPQGRPNR